MRTYFKAGIEWCDKRDPDGFSFLGQSIDISHKAVTCLRDANQSELKKRIQSHLTYCQRYQPRSRDSGAVEVNRFMNRLTWLDLTQWYLCTAVRRHFCCLIIHQKGNTIFVHYKVDAAWVLGLLLLFFILYLGLPHSSLQHWEPHQWLSIHC